MSSPCCVPSLCARRVTGWLKSGSTKKPTPWANTSCPEVETKTYPHAIVYDFESYQDTSKAVRPTSDLFYESEHIPISVSLADTLNPEPEYIVSRDPVELIRLFHQSLERRHTAIVADVGGQILPPRQ